MTRTRPTAVRMFLLALTLGFACFARADGADAQIVTLVDTLGDCSGGGIGPSIGNVGALNTPRDVGFQFAVPSGPDLQITDIVVCVSATGAPYVAPFALFTDAAGEPGVAIDTFDVSAGTSLGFSAALADTGAVLEGGGSYWLVALRRGARMDGDERRRRADARARPPRARWRRRGLRGGRPRARDRRARAGAAAPASRKQPPGIRGAARGARDPTMPRRSMLPVTKLLDPLAALERDAAFSDASRPGVRRSTMGGRARQTEFLAKGTWSRYAARALGLALLLGVGIGAAASAENLIVNGSFDTDVSGWSVGYHAPFIGIAWDALDLYDPTPSGFMQATSTIDNAGAAGPAQCVGVIGHPALWMSVDVVILPQSFEYLYADPYVRYYTALGCTGSEIDSEFPIGTVTMGQGLKRISGPVVPPGGTQSILVDLGIVKPATSWPATVYFDNVHLPEPTEAVGGAAALLALAAFARWRDARA